MDDSDSVRLFSDQDFGIAEKFLNLSRRTMRLYIRIFQRTLTWYRKNKVKYEKIAKDLTPFFDELQREGFFMELKGKHTEIISN